MAGTPTPNYQFPTYAETDTPNLAGAYNQAVNAIDAKIKEVADTIPSDTDVPDATSTTKGIAKLYDSATVGESTQDDGGITPAAMKGYVDAKVPAEQQAYTGTAPIMVDNEERTISVAVAGAVSSSEGSLVDGSKGTVSRLAIGNDGNSANIIDGNTNWNTDLYATVPTVGVLKDYVARKMVAAGAAYTGNAPIVVNNGSKTISVNIAGTASTSEGSTTYNTPGTVRVAGNSQTLVGVANDTIGGDHKKEAVNTVPNCYTVNAFVNSQIGSDQAANLAGATQQLTVDMLSNLWVNPTTGFVFYKAPTE